MGKWALNDAIANSEDFLSFGRLSFGMNDVPMSDVPSTSGQTEVRVNCAVDGTNSLEIFPPASFCSFFSNFWSWRFTERIPRLDASM